MRVFQESADYMLSKHNKAFLGALQHMMVAVFGPGMEQAFSKAPVQGGHCGAGRVKLSATVTEPATSASSSERWKSSFPASSTWRWETTSSASTAGLRRTANPATTAGQHRSACATAKSVPTHVRRCSIRLAWGPVRFRSEDCSGEQLAAKKPVRRRLP
jgi:hypothetical protein